MWQAQRHFKAGKVKRIIATTLADVETQNVARAARM
jgi:hypothetical protein